MNRLHSVTSAERPNGEHRGNVAIRVDDEGVPPVSIGQLKLWFHRNVARSLQVLRNGDAEVLFAVHVAVYLRY